jgi:DNA-binding winged helix-turn-helix (wHTH) protein
VRAGVVPRPLTVLEVFFNPSYPVKLGPMPPAQASSVYQFGPFRLETAERRLRRGNEVVPLRAKVFDTLCALVERHGHLVTKNEFFARVWPDAIVEENNLALNINALRKALRSAGWEDPFIETVPGQGYRFTAPVRLVSADGSLQDARFAPVTETIAPPLIEREADLETLRASHQRALAGQRQFVCLAGEAGIGKTALLQRFLRELTGPADQPLLGYGQSIE